MEWLDNNTIRVTPAKRPKKITGTRFAAIMNLNKWNTPFKTWCEITRTYEEPFEDTIYTIAGKTIEPKQAEYMRKAYFMYNLKSPEDIYGKNYFNNTRGDFFPESKIFGGMWDYLLLDDDDNTDAVLEMKTTKRSEDWEDDIPEYYALQAALYAHLKGVDRVIMVVSFLEDKDYEHPEDFKPSAENTAVIPFSVSERYPDFLNYIKRANKFWKNHVETGISPAYDEKKDAAILKELKKNNVNPDTELTELVSEAEELQIELDAISAQYAEKEKRLKTLKDQIKEISKARFRPGDKEVVVSGSAFDWVTSKSVTVKIDEDLMKQDGVLEKYKTKISETIKLVAKKKK